MAILVPNSIGTGYSKSVPKLYLSSTFSPVAARVGEPVALADQIVRPSFECELGIQFCETHDAPAWLIRMMVGLHSLKYTYNLSDEQMVGRWGENPYGQHFCGEKWFRHTPPLDSSSMTSWRKRIGENRAKPFLAQSIAAGLKTEMIQPPALLGGRRHR